MLTERRVRPRCAFFREKNPESLTLCLGCLLHPENFLVSSPDLEKFSLFFNPTLISRGTLTWSWYQCAGLYDDGRLIGICGLWIFTKYYVGRHIEPDNVVILEGYRSRGLGTRLMAWVHEYGKSQGAIASELNCYLPNERGNAFWERDGYRKIAWHCQRPLEQ
ncbi:GNAT family N-acetyltransferase [Thiomonas sp.]